MTKLIAVLSLAALFTVAAPRGLSAAGCTEDYIGCIADAGLLDEPFRTMKDIECATNWAGCLARNLKFW